MFERRDFQVPGQNSCRSDGGLGQMWTGQISKGSEKGRGAASGGTYWDRGGTYWGQVRCQRVSKGATLLTENIEGAADRVAAITWRAIGDRSDVNAFRKSAPC
jgi:hypothetical protein